MKGLVAFKDWMKILTNIYLDEYNKLRNLRDMS